MKLKTSIINFFKSSKKKVLMISGFPILTIIWWYFLSCLLNLKNSIKNDK